MGDCVLTTPALEILKRFRPDLRLAVMVEDRFCEIFQGNPDLDEILPVALSALRRWRPRLCLNLHGGTRSAWLTALSGAPFRAGFAHFRHQSAYKLHIPRAQQILGVARTVHTAEHLASAVFYLGAPIAEIPRAKLAASSVGQTIGFRRLPLAALHPFAATSAKTWPAPRFAAIAEHLKDSGLDPIFIGGPSDDLTPFRRFGTISGAPLSEIKSVLAGAALFIGNDSGPAHIAAAFGVPSVVIFGASDPAIWGPWRAPSEIVAAPGGVAAVTTTQVLEALARLKVPA